MKLCRPLSLIAYCSVTVASLASNPTINHDAVSNETAAPEAWAQRTYFYAGGEYVNTTQPGLNKSTIYMKGQIYVEKLVPREVKHALPLVFIAGAGQTGSNWLNTPDGRQGWASYYLSHGFVVYLTDQSQRGRSPWFPGEGSIYVMPVIQAEEQFTAPQDFPSYPQAKNHTQWPGTGRAGDPIFDTFMRSQVEQQSNETLQAIRNNASYAALMDDIGPAIVFAHSQAGTFGWQVGDARPDLVKAIVAIEPEGPPFENWGGPPFAPGYASTSPARPFGLTILPLQYDPPVGSNFSLLTKQNHSATASDLAPCIRQKEPARKLANLSKIPVLFLTSESSYHAVYDYCTVAFLKQAGVDVEYIHLPDVGIKGNGHFIFMEKNNLKTADFILPWITEHAGNKTSGRWS